MQLAVALADRFNGEIINGDALQIYEGLQITTNKIPLEERKGVPHHLLGCAKIGEEPWTVRRFRDEAVRVVAEIAARGRLPILVGGTHYYTQSLLFKNALASEEAVEQSTLEAKEPNWPVLDASTEDLFEELMKVDQVMASRWHPKDRRKIRRSLEICLKTGQKASEIYGQQQHQKPCTRATYLDESDNRLIHNNNFNKASQLIAESLLRYDPLVLWTHASTEALNLKLEKRVDNMMSEGLLEEVKTMYTFLQRQQGEGHPVDQSRGVWVAIGFKEFLPYVSSNINAEDLKQRGAERTKIATRQYAKRQSRWIRLKLQRAINAVMLEHRMFLLDATDVAEWSRNVELKAKDIAAAFLRGDALPDPGSLSDIAKRLLTVHDEEERFLRHCEFCGKNLMSENEWINHLKSKGHKSAVRPKIDWRALYPSRV